MNIKEPLVLLNNLPMEQIQNKKNKKYSLTEKKKRIPGRMKSKQFFSMQEKQLWPSHYFFF